MWRAEGNQPNCARARVAMSRRVATAASIVALLFHAASAGTSRKPNKYLNPRPCDLFYDLSHLSRNPNKTDYPRQEVSGPMQADEMLLLFSLIRTSSVRRVLEIGGFHGDSAFNFLQALRCKRNATVITVDVRSVKRHEHIVPHKTLRMDAANLTMADVDGEAVDAILLDCHAYYSTQAVLRNVFERRLLSRDGYIFLHDTGLHREHTRHDQYNTDPPAGCISPSSGSLRCGCNLWTAASSASLRTTMSERSRRAMA